MKFTEHEDYALTESTVKMVRHCIEGEPAIKRETTTYLKHPNPFDQSSAWEVIRYAKYIEGAEFDEIAKATHSSMIGQMTEGEINIDLPDRIAYLEQNADGDGMSLAGVCELIYSNCLQVKFHILVAEYRGLADVDIESVSIADLKQLSPRSTIKQYSRESMIDWGFTRIGGVMQLSLAVLVEHGVLIGPDLVKTEVKSYLVLGLDENGDYYQQKYVEDNGNVFADGEKHYPIVGGKRLKWIPIEIVFDQEVPAGKIPRDMGYLYSLCSKDLAAYRVSADYKEALRQMQPTTFTSGWKTNDQELFKELNNREYIAFGAGVSNNLPEGVEVDIKGMGVEAQPFLDYFERNESQSIKLGAQVETQTQNATATEIRSRDRKSKAVMISIIKNTEAALRRIVSYCAMYEGLWSPDDVENNLDQIVIDLPKDFAKTTMTPDEVNAIATAYNAGLISKKEAVRKLVAGGFTVSDAETILDELEQQAAVPVANPMPIEPNQI